MTQKFVVLPVEVAERALYALQEAEMLMEHRQNVDLRLASIQSIQEALKQQNPWWYATVPAGWRLVPVEPKISMKQAALNASRRWAECDAPLPRTQELWASEVCWKAMIEAAPQPPAVEQPQIDWQDMYLKEKRRAEMWIAKYEKDIGKLEVAVPVAAQPPSVAARTCANCLHNKPPFGNCDGCSQQNDDADDEGNWEPIPEPQVEQELAALVVAYDKQGWRQMLDDMRKIPDGTPLYTHPQPKREPLLPKS